MKKLLFILLLAGCKPAYYEVKYSVNCADCLSTFETPNGSQQRYGSFEGSFDADKGQYLYLSSTGTSPNISISLDGKVWKSDKCSGNCSVTLKGAIQ